MQDASELLVAGSAKVWIAPAGATLPDGSNGLEDVTGDPGDDFVELGYTTEDGEQLTVTPTISEHRAHQARQAIRRDLVAQEIQIAFQLEQWNSDTVRFAFSGGEVTDMGEGVTRYDFPAATDDLDERALIFDWVDGDKHGRLVLPRGNATEGTETSFTRDGLSVLPITFKALAEEDNAVPAYVLTDDPAWAPVGS